MLELCRCPNIYGPDCILTATKKNNKPSKLLSVHPDVCVCVREREREFVCLSFQMNHVYCHSSSVEL